MKLNDKKFGKIFAEPNRTCQNQPNRIFGRFLECTVQKHNALLLAETVNNKVRQRNIIILRVSQNDLHLHFISYTVGVSKK